MSHPFAPEWAEVLQAHRRCWQLFLDRRADRGRPVTITPKFDLDAYMPLQPFTAEPPANVQEPNASMAAWLRSLLLA